MKNFFSFKSHLAYMRKQPEKVQHVYAGSLAGIITTLFVAYILYTDYGFWHEKYKVGEEIKENKVEVLGPKDTVVKFFNDAKNEIQNIKSINRSVISGKEVYIDGK